MTPARTRLASAPRRPVPPRSREGSGAAAISLACLALLLFALPSTAQQQAFLDLRYRPHVETVVTAQAVADTVYLPVSETLGALGIDHSVDRQAGRVSGFFLEEDRRYELDFSVPEARMQGERLPLRADEFLEGDLDYYVRPAVLERVFGLDVTVDFLDLAVGIRAPEPLPPARVAERERRRRLAEGEPPGLRDPAPLEFDRERRHLDGTVLDYSASATARSRGVDGSLSLGVGAEVLGGDIQGRTRFRATEDGVEHLGGGGTWRYVYDPEGRTVSEVEVGEVTSGAGPGFFRLEGVRLTNEPLEPRRVMDTHRIEGVAEPDWEVELYVNRRLVDYTRADARGFYEFEIPLAYGSPVVTLEYHGPAGQHRVEERRLPIPRTFLPPGEADYHLAAGRTGRFGLGAQTGIAAGVSDRLTLEFGADYLEGEDRNLEDGTPGAFAPRTSVNLRLGDRFMARGDASLGTLYRVRAEAHLSARSRLELTHTEHGDHPAYSPAGVERSSGLQLFVPRQRSTVPMTFRARATASQRTGGHWEHMVDANATFTGQRVRPSLGVRRTSAGPLDPEGGRHEVSVGTAFHVPALGDLGVGERGEAGTALWFGGLLPRAAARTLERSRFTVSTSYDTRMGGMADRRFTWSRRVAGRGRLSMSLIQRPTAPDAFEASLTLDRLGFRSTSSVRSGATTSVTQRVQGAVGADPSHRDMHFTDRPMVGRAGAAIVLFVDEDGSGEWSPGDRIVEGRVRFHRPVSLERDDRGILRTGDLQAYRRYSVEIDESSIRDPMLVPAFESFSFVADPNRLKRIEVPLQPGGVVQGRVEREVGEERRGVAGIQLEVVDEEGEVVASMRTFRDGSFYEHPVPPGSYTLRVSPTQASALDLERTSAETTFQVEAKAGGDFVERTLVVEWREDGR